MLWLVGLALLATGALRVPEKQGSPEALAKYAIIKQLIESDLQYLRIGVPAELRRAAAMRVELNTLAKQMGERADRAACDPGDAWARARRNTAPAKPCADHDSLKARILKLRGALNLPQRPSAEAADLHYAIRTWDTLRTTSEWLKWAGTGWLALMFVLTWMWLPTGDAAPASQSGRAP